MTDHPITPPPELAAQWVAEIYGDPAIPLHPITLRLVERAAQWGADTELAACCEWLQDPDLNVDTYKLRAARRPKPSSLKERALSEVAAAVAGGSITPEQGATIRLALEAAHPNHPKIPDSSLVRRVAAVIDNGTACDREDARIARAAIREVAAWLRENPDLYFPPALVFALEQEAER